MRRPDEESNLDELESQLPGISSKVHYVDAPLLEIASREIRSRIAEGHPSAIICPSSVYEYINQHHLYNHDPQSSTSKIVKFSYVLTL